MLRAKASSKVLPIVTPAPPNGLQQAGLVQFVAVSAIDLGSFQTDRLDEKASQIITSFGRPATILCLAQPMALFFLC